MIALVCIAKNEDNYIDEWVDYHKKLGFVEIFIYQNDWRAKTANPNANYLISDGPHQQVPSYNSFINENRHRFDWAAFLDVDEFIVLKKHRDIKDFLKDYNDLPALGLNWYLFGDSGLKGTPKDYSSIKRFTKRKAIVDQHIKTILNLRIAEDVRMDVHHPNCKVYDTNKSMLKGGLHPNGPSDIAQINHYFCRTKTEYVAKCQRGFACNTPSAFRSISDYDHHNFNEVEDLAALDFMYGSR